MIRRLLAATIAWAALSATAATPAANYTDLWWNPNESGWGLTIAHQGNALFALLYTYDQNGQALWLSMSNGMFVGNGTYSGALYSATGPAFNARPWTQATLTQVGNMTLTFNDGQTGTLTYTLGGTRVVKPITRAVLTLPLPLCAPS